MPGFTEGWSIDVCLGQLPQGGVNAQGLAEGDQRLRAVLAIGYTVGEVLLDHVVRRPQVFCCVFNATGREHRPWRHRRVVRAVAHFEGSRSVLCALLVSENNPAHTLLHIEEVVGVFSDLLGSRQNVNTVFIEVNVLDPDATEAFAHDDKPIGADYAKDTAV